MSRYFLNFIGRNFLNSYQRQANSNFRPVRKFCVPDNSNGIGQIEKKLKLAFTCKKCDVRTIKIISNQAYTKGVVIVKCDGCFVNHLIADNLNWFTDLNGKKNIEDILREKGEIVRKTEEGVLEVEVDNTVEAILIK